jgi:hypothetical protein
MEVKEFISIIKEELPDFLPDDVYKDLVIDDVEVAKMNDQKLHGLTFKPKGSDAAPTLYIDDLYERHENGEDIGFLLVDLANRYAEARKAPTPPDIDLSWDKVKDSLSVRLLEKKRNIDFLSNMPYVDVGNGLAMTVDINMPGDMQGEWRIAVNHGVMQQLGVDRNELFLKAMESAVSYDPATLTDMSQALFSPDKENLLDRTEPLEPMEVGGMYVLTTESGNLGASALFYPDVKEKAAEMLGSGYYVLPSSIHECILVPETAGINEKELCDMVKQANRTVVEPKDVLSDNVYHYDRESRSLNKVEPQRDKADRVAEAR